MDLQNMDLKGGSLQISTEVIGKIARCAALEIEGVAEVSCGKQNRKVTESSNKARFFSFSASRARQRPVARYRRDAGRHGRDHSGNCSSLWRAHPGCG